MKKWTFLFCFLCLVVQGQQQYQDYIGNGHHLGVSVSTSSNLQASDGFNTVSGIGKMPDLESASRFLGQATLGADYETIEDLTQTGISQWIEEQFNEPAFPFLTHLDDTLTPAAYLSHVNAGENPADFGIWEYFRFVWWESIMTGNDLLRDRVTLALSEIFVISSRSDLYDYTEGVCDYYEMLHQNAFGNYRDLLYDVTMHPAMGNYLSHLNNPKSNPLANTFPDENYAREVMQLFSIGLYELNQDGSRKLDANGDFIPTYDNEDIREFAKIFTGLGAAKWSRHAIEEDTTNWGPVPFGACLWCTDLTLPMKMFEEEHEPGTKYLLNGQIVPTGQTAMEDINDAIDNLYNHPNVGPFIGKLLIQRLVKSNPSPEYIFRVAGAFNDNGSGVRGDLQAVIRAILLDPEARDCSWIDVMDHGMLREPIVRYTHAVRAFNASNSSGRFYNWAGYFEDEQLQHPMNSPSVFNFFLPDYQPLGMVADLDLVAPEFQIFNSATSLSYVNLNRAYFNWDYVFDDFVGWYPDRNNPPAGYQTSLDMSDEEGLITAPYGSVFLDAEIEELIDRLDIILTHGNLSENTKQVIRDTADGLYADPWAITRFTAWIIMISPDYAVMK